jgi:hypothetical protein
MLFFWAISCYSLQSLVFKKKNKKDYHQLGSPGYWYFALICSSEAVEALLLQLVWILPSSEWHCKFEFYFMLFVMFIFSFWVPSLCLLSSLIWIFLGHNDNKIVCLNVSFSQAMSFWETWTISVFETIWFFLRQNDKVLLFGEVFLGFNLSFWGTKNLCLVLLNDSSLVRMTKLSCLSGV